MTNDAVTRTVGEISLGPSPLKYKKLSIFWFPYWEVYLAWILDLKRYNQ